VSLVERLHDVYASQRRVRKLADHLAPLVPKGARVLDVGCGDGLLDLALVEKRPDIELHGLDVQLRQKTHIPVEPFDGRHIPHPDNSFDALLLVDVLHHAEDAEALLRETIRVARSTLLIKDHTLEGPLAGPTLRFMDDVGNARYDVARPYDYWPRDRWLATFRELGLELEHWRRKLDLYPWPLSMVFGRSLHFIARLAVP
jgi:SAM-dependent methyltransferase